MHWRATRIAGEIRPHDGCLDVEGRAIARVYIVAYGPCAGEWAWFYQGAPAANGRAPTKAAAKAECERRARAQGAGLKGSTGRMADG